MPQAHRRRAHARDVILAESFAQPAFRQLLQKDFPFLNEQLRTKDEPGGFNCSPISVGTCAVPESNIDWESLPPGIDPSFGELKGYRAQRKRDQVQSLARIVCAIAEPGDRIVEFGAGSGHLGILLAHLLPQCHVVLIERNAFRLELARKRVEAAKLSNIELSATDATQFNRHAIASLYGELGLKLGRDQSGAQGSSNRARTALDSRRAAFQIGIGLHTCGLLTDVRCPVILLRRLRNSNSHGILTLRDFCGKHRRFKMYACNWGQSMSCPLAAMARHLDFLHGPPLSLRRSRQTSSTLWRVQLTLRPMLRTLRLCNNRNFERQSGACRFDFLFRCAFRFIFSRGAVLQHYLTQRTVQCLDC